MTKLSSIGIENLELSVEKHFIELPTDDITARDLEMWLRGYNDCQNRVLKIISNFREVLERTHD